VLLRSGVESSQVARVLSSYSWWTDTGTDMSRGQSPDFASGALPTTGLVDHQSRLAGYAAAAPSTFRLRAGCSASTWMAPDRSGLLTLDAPSVQTAPDGSRRIVWMIKRMIKQGRRTRWVESGRPPDIESGALSTRRDQRDGLRFVSAVSRAACALGTWRSARLVADSAACSWCCSRSSPRWC
jgi:hypothetical protein